MTGGKVKVMVTLVGSFEVLLMRNLDKNLNMNNIYLSTITKDDKYCYMYY